MAKVSVVMCCYNSERYIKETIDSVLNQSFTDYEFIIWNDGSTDSTEQIIKSYKDKRIIYRKDINRGEGVAAQLACNLATAKYIARIDSDDVWLPHKIAFQYNYMESHPNVVLLSCPVIFIDKDSKELGRSFPVTKTGFLNKSIEKENRFPHSGSIYRKEIYNKVGGYNNIRLIQDYLLFLKMSKYGDLALCPIPLIKYRLLFESVSNRVNSSPYKYVIYSLNRKISKDLGTVDKDIEIFNEIYNMVEKKSDIYIYNENFSNKFYNILSKLLGKNNSYRLMVFLMNLLCY